MAYRYIGNKTKILNPILEAIGDIVPLGATVADLMCGTGSVAEALRFSGYRVVASDIMTYAFQHAYIRLLFDGEPEFSGLGSPSYDEILKTLENIEPVKGYFVKEYSPAGKPENGCEPRKYFTAENAALIDAISNQLNIWCRNGNISERENILLRHDLVLAANDIANIAGTYGHYRSKWNGSSLQPLKLKPSTFSQGASVDHTVMQGPAEESAAKSSADLCYLDPPYTKRQYAANYHILETLARGDSPPAIGISGLRPWRDQYSDFCSKLKIRDAFTAIFEKMDCPHFLISYSEDGLLTYSQMKSFLSKFGKVQCKKINHVRFRSNNSPLSRDIDEYLFHLHKD